MSWPGDCSAPPTQGPALTQLTPKLVPSLERLEGTALGRGRGGERFADGPREQTLAGVSGEMQQLLRILQGADATPTTTAVTACEEAGKSLRQLLSRWGELKDKDIKALNERLSKAGLTPLAPKSDAGKDE